MLTWLFKRKIFSLTISDLSTFSLLKRYFLFKKKKKEDFECYSRRKIGGAKFYIHRQHIILVYIQRKANKSDTILSIHAFFCGLTNKRQEETRIKIRIRIVYW